jgi:hypothetical protein
VSSLIVLVHNVAQRSKVTMVKFALWWVMLNFDMFDELCRTGESIVMSSATLNRAAMWAMNFVPSREVLL